MLKLNAYQLKWIAIIGMFLNHAVYAWEEVLPLGVMVVLYAFGGLTFPILAYFVVEGYRHTSNLKRYILRLLIFGVIAVPLHMMVFGGFGINILFTIILSLCFLKLYDTIKIRALFWIVFVIINIITVILFIDWFIIGPIVVLLYHIIKNENARRIVPGIVAGVLWLGLLLFLLVSMLGVYSTGGAEALAALEAMAFSLDIVYASLSFFIGCFAAAYLIKNFNGERGKKMKWTFYVAYPVHFIILIVVGVALGIMSFGF
ncbi:MAG: conjugal transfer protein TraX [Defluviitaleaceae bacterium]|nr:conjugal transfer protein TraX [Defluviitaleaceae bacterium]